MSVVVGSELGTCRRFPSPEETLPSWWCGELTNKDTGERITYPDRVWITGSDE